MAYLVKLLSYMNYAQGCARPYQCCEFATSSERSDGGIESGTFPGVDGNSG